MVPVGSWQPAANFAIITAGGMRTPLRLVYFKLRLRLRSWSATTAADGAAVCPKRQGLFHPMGKRASLAEASQGCGGCHGKQDGKDHLGALGPWGGLQAISGLNQSRGTGNVESMRLVRC